VKNKFLARADEALFAFRNERQRLRYRGHSVYAHIPRQEARALYDGGSCVKDVAELYGCSAAAMREILYQAGATLRDNYRRDVPQKLVAKMYRQGATGVAIAKKLGASNSLIYKRLDSAGVERRKNRALQMHGRYRHDIPQELVVKKYLQGATGAEIGKELGTTTGTVYKRLDEAGVKRREGVAPHSNRKKIKSSVNPEKAVKLYREYGSVQRVAEELSICATFAKRLIVDGGMNPQRGDRTDISIKQAVRAYRSYGSINQAAKKLGCHYYALSSRLIEAGEIEYKSNFSDDVVASILREFDSGKSIYTLSKYYHVGRTPIQLLLLAHDRKIRSPYKIPQAPLSSLARRHANGEPIYKLAEEAGICFQTLSEKLKAAGYKVHSSHGRRELPKRLFKKICRRLEAGYNINQVAEETKYSAQVISRRLREQGYTIPRMPTIPHNKRVFTHKEEKAICKAYDAGSSISSLKLTYGLKAFSPIRKVIAASGRHIRGPNEQLELERQLRLDKLIES